MQGILLSSPLEKKKSLCLITDSPSKLGFGFMAGLWDFQLRTIGVMGLRPQDTHTLWVIAKGGEVFRVCGCPGSSHFSSCALVEVGEGQQ